MKRLFQIFELSANEQRVVLIIMAILITIAFVAYGRRNHQPPIDSAVVTHPKSSPTVVETVDDR